MGLIKGPPATEDNEYTDFEYRVAEILHRKHRWRWRALSAWIVVFSAVVIIGFHYIQNSRLESCKRNYGAFNEVFHPFFKPPLTAEQSHNLKVLGETVRDLKSSCDTQIDAGILEGRW